MKKRHHGLVVIAAFIAAMTIFTACDTDDTGEDTSEATEKTPEIYTVTFVTDGTVSTDHEDRLSQTVTEGQCVKVPYLYKAKDKYTAVVGWYLDEGLTAEWDKDSPVTDNLTVYPKWGNYYDSVYFNAAKIYIETEHKRPINSKTTYVKCSVSITNAGEYNLEATSAQIRGRGNTTWTTISDKKPYRIKFDKKTDLFDMGPEKDYLLIANYIDYTLMRNDLVYDTARRIGLAYTTETEWAHVFVNGDYRGLYLLCEQTETGKYRINIGKDDEPGNELKSGEEIGFLIEMDGAGDNGDDRYFQFKPIATKVGVRQWRNNFKMIIRSPGGEYITDGQYEYIKDYMTEVHRAIALRDWNKLTTLVDIDSLVDYFIVTELSYAVDMGWAFYMYKPAGDKLYFGPVWDYDQAFGDSSLGGEKYDSWYSGEENIWFTWLLEVAQFRTAVQERWDEVYEDVILKTIDRIPELYDRYQYDAGANFVCWDAIGHHYWRSVEKIVQCKTYRSNVVYLKSWTKNRVDWMNTTIRSW